jgi:hypothetical protein
MGTTFSFFVTLAPQDSQQNQGSTNMLKKFDALGVCSDRAGFSGYPDTAT